MMKKRVYRWLLFLIIVLSPVFRLEALDPGKPIHRYLLNKWGKGQGLSSEIVVVVTQTADGFLWIGTDNGLFRYDGSILEPFNFSDRADGEFPYITSLLVDKDNGLWIGGKYNLAFLKNNILQYIKKEHGSPLKSISHIYQDSEGSVWIAANGNYLYRFRDGKFTTFDNTHGIVSETYSMLEDKNGNLWVANTLGGLRLNRNGKFIRYPLKILESKKNDFYSVYQIYEDRKSVLWIGTNVGLLGIANVCTNSEKVVAYITSADGLSNNNIWSILEDNNGNLWVGTEKGLNRISRGPTGKTVIDILIKDSIIQALYEDREKNLWLAPIGSGLNQLRDSTFYNYWQEQGLPYWFLSLYSGTDGEISVGTTLGSLFRFDKENTVFRKILQIGDNVESEIETIEEDSEGWLWLGTVARGIWKMKNGKTIRYTSSNGLLKDGVGVIHRDSWDRMWIGYIKGGVSCYQNGVFQHITRGTGKTFETVYVILEDKNHDILIGSSNGIDVLPGGDLDKRNFKTYLPGLEVTDIYEDNSGVYWISTLKEGLKRFEKGKWFSYSQNDSLESKEICKILEDNRENFWIGTNDGILRISKTELNDVAAGKRKQFQVTVFGLSDGMRHTRNRQISNNSAIKTRDGELWFGSLRGISVVNPENVYINKYPPTVVIKEILFDYEYIPMESSGKSFTGIKDILFYFTAPSFTSPERVKILYKLEGYDRDWRAIAPLFPRKAHYKNVPPGHYRFRVIACNSSGIWNNTGASFAFTLKPYFYQTLLFQFTAFVIGLSLVIGFYYALRKFLRFRKLENKYKNSTLNPLKAEKCLIQLERLMQVEKLYRDENLTLDSLAKKLSIAPRYLSQIVNDQLNKNFRDYLNEYRIEEAKELLVKQGKNDRYILGSALEVGFNSKEVFNRAFKKFTGVTPSEYIKTHSKVEKK